LAEKQQQHVERAVVGLLDPLDETDHQQNRDRIVQSRLALESPS
jgi:hypothetical protein